MPDNLSLLQKQIIDFGNSAEFKELNAYYSQPSIFSALGVSRHENTHSNFLAWLITPKPEKNDHGLGDMPLRKFLEALSLACTLPHSIGKISPDLSGAITAGTYTLSGVEVEREKHVGVGRIDIYITGNIEFDQREYPLTIVIENKVKSSEHDSQTKRYLEALRPPVSRPGFFLSVFLTPLSNREYELQNEPTCEAKEFIELNYQYLADYVIEPCRNSLQEGSIKRYLTEYLLALSLPEMRQDKGDFVMAISSEERILLSRFWDKHKDLLTAVILSMGDYVPLDDAESEIVLKASKVLENAVQRDLSRFSWQFSGGGDKTSQSPGLCLKS
uniref:PD-(D/E)XK nuclease superfamily n=1 Tax=Dulem virus 37 TaxID=3145755 RepID=A0AAU8AY92_9CAUD